MYDHTHLSKAQEVSHKNIMHAVAYGLPGLTARESTRELGFTLCYPGVDSKKLFDHITNPIEKLSLLSKLNLVSDPQRHLRKDVHSSCYKAREIAEGVRYLHSKRPPIIHESLDPWSISVLPDGTPQIIDLGWGKIASCASTFQLPDEMKAFKSRDDALSNAGDVYSLALVIFFVSRIDG